MSSQFPAKAIVLQIQVFKCLSSKFFKGEFKGVDHFAEVPHALSGDEHFRVGFDNPFNLLI